MFGHLLLRVDQKGQTKRTSILAYTINYAADVTTDNGILFAMLGLTGGFKGYFSTHPYTSKPRNTVILKTEIFGNTDSISQKIRCNDC